MAMDWLRAFPRNLAPSVTAVAADLPKDAFEAGGLITNSYSRAWPSLVVSGDDIEIPYRMYHRPIPPERWGSPGSTESTILGCMYSRHHDGRVRQAALTTLLGSTEPFVAPFLIQLLGGYVLEIVEEIAARIDRDHGDAGDLLGVLSQFAQGNPAFMTLTEARARSYWAEYYRSQFMWARDYPALVAISKISA
jgi:hypothetical protein